MERLKRYNEAETRAFLIQPVLENRGWTRGYLDLERDAGYYVKRSRLSGKNCKSDYTLLGEDEKPIGVIEAKAMCEDRLKRHRTLLDALVQARDFSVAVSSRRKALHFVFATDGVEFVECSLSDKVPDSIEGLTVVSLNRFPTLQMLSRRLPQEQHKWEMRHRRRAVGTSRSGDRVFVQGSAVYHRKHCEYYRERSKKGEFPDARAAELAGFYPCSYCNNGGTR